MAYYVKNLLIIFSRPWKPASRKLGIKHQGLDAFQIYLNDTGLTFMERSNLFMGKKYIYLIRMFHHLMGKFTHYDQRNQSSQLGLKFCNKAVVCCCMYEIMQKYDCARLVIDVKCCTRIDLIMLHHVNRCNTFSWSSDLLNVCDTVCCIFIILF